MALVRVKTKYQVTLPNVLRRQIGIGVGDVLEAAVERGKITFTPKAMVDRGIGESLKEFRQGRSYGPFDSPEAMLRSLHKTVHKIKKAAKRASS